MPSPSKVSSSDSELIAYVDGASRGNPGPASYGVVIQNAKGEPVDTLSEFLGETTNNVAEYRALIAALEYAVAKQSVGLKIYCDSQLVAMQMRGRYRVQSPDLKPLFERARKLAVQIGSFSIHHVPREQNRKADLLANKALDQATSAHHAISRGSNAQSVAAAPGPAASGRIHSFFAIVDSGKLCPLAPLPDLEDGAEYEVRARKR